MINYPAILWINNEPVHVHDLWEALKTYATKEGLYFGYMLISSDKNFAVSIAQQQFGRIDTYTTFYATSISFPPEFRTWLLLNNYH